MIVLRNKKINKLAYTLIILVACVLLHTSCAKRPKDVLSRKDMQELIYDIHKTDGVLHALDIPLRNTEERHIYYQTLLEQHNTTQAQFDSSLVWYTAHPKTFEKIYLNVLQRLEKEFAQLSIAQIPNQIDYPDINYWRSLGAITINQLPNDTQRALYIIINQTENAFEVDKEEWTLHPIPEIKETTKKTKTSLPRTFITADTEQKKENNK